MRGGQQGNIPSASRKMFDDMEMMVYILLLPPATRTEQEQQQIYDESMAEYIEKDILNPTQNRNRTLGYSGNK